MATEQKIEEAVPAAQTDGDSAGDAPDKDSLTVTDNRTGESYELAITDGTVRAMDLRQIKVVRGRLRADDV